MTRTAPACLCTATGQRGAEGSLLRRGGNSHVSNHSSPPGGCSSVGKHPAARRPRAEGGRLGCWASGSPTGRGAHGGGGLTPQSRGRSCAKREGRGAAPRSPPGGPAPHLHPPEGARRHQQGPGAGVQGTAVPSSPQPGLAGRASCVHAKRHPRLPGPVRRRPGSPTARNRAGQGCSPDSTQRGVHRPTGSCDGPAGHTPGHRQSPGVTSSPTCETR